MIEEPAAYPCPCCPFVGVTAADLADHRIIRRYTDPDVHGEEPPD